MRIRLALTLATLALVAVPAAAAAATPAGGPYHGIVNGTSMSPCGGNEGSCWFRYRSGAGKITALTPGALWCNIGTVELMNISPQSIR